MGTTVQVTHEAACPDIGPVCAERDEPPQIHDQRFWIAELRVLAEYAVTSWLAAELQLPVRLSATTIVFRRLDGTAFEPEYADIHHRNETLFGIGDPWLTARGRFRFGSLLLAPRLGLTVPLGRTETNPFALGRMGLTHQHVQFGTGTVTPILGLDASYQWERVLARAYGQAQLSLYEKDKGYQAGSRFAGGLAGDFTVVPTLKLGALAEVLAELPERWDGVIEQDGNVGRVDVLVGGTAAWTIENTTLTLSVRVPVFQHFIVSHHGAGQLRYPAIVMLGVQQRVELF